MNGFNIWPDLAMAAKKPALVIINQNTNTKEVMAVESIFFCILHHSLS